MVRIFLFEVSSFTNVFIFPGLYRMQQISLGINSIRLMESILPKNMIFRNHSNFDLLLLYYSSHLYPADLLLYNKLNNILLTSSKR